MTDRDEIWITGIGAATPLGSTLAEIEANLLAGRSGVSLVTRFATADYPSRIAGQVSEIPVPTSRDRAEFAARPAIEQLALWCVECALRDSGLFDSRREIRVGLVLGLGAEWMLLWEADHHRGGDRVIDPGQDRQSTLGRVVQSLELTGPAIALSAACASGNHAIEIARQWLRLGLVDACVAAACDLAVSPIGMATFGNLRTLSRRNDNPAAASRPFDRDRDGFVIGEGGVGFTLERSASARKRSSPAYAQVAGWGATSDAYHHVIPSPNPEPAITAIRRALEDARINPDQIDHVNAHATGTPVGDAGEAVVLRTVLGPATSRIPVTATKSLTGHLLTAAGTFEALACITALRHQAIPPTINLDSPDVDLCLVAHEARPHPVKIVLSNSFGFGGSNTSLVLRAV
jgi:3-oxoacyl-[acyl-carrier-protein] synthase II